MSTVALLVCCDRLLTSVATTGEAAAGLAGARRLDGGVQGEQIGLPGDRVDRADDGADRVAKPR